MKKMLEKTLPVMIALVLIAASAAGAFAETVKGTVTYDGGDLDLEYSVEDIQDALGSLTPGDDVELEFTLKNNSGRAADWYVEDSVAKAFEESSEGTDGAYNYSLTYTSASGKTTEIYSNDVGGATSDTTIPKGLKQASSGSEEYFYLDRIANGKTGTLKLAVAIDGETLDNNYQASLAELDVNFAVEEPDDPETVTTSKPKTGDETRLIVYIVLFAIAALLLAGTAVLMFRSGKRGGADD